MNLLMLGSFPDAQHSRVVVAGTESPKVMGLGFTLGLTCSVGEDLFEGGCFSSKQPWGNGITGRGHSKSRGLEVGACLGHRDISEEASDAGAESKGEGRRLVRSQGQMVPQSVSAAITKYRGLTTGMSFLAVLEPEVYNPGVSRFGVSEVLLPVLD